MKEYVDIALNHGHGCELVLDGRNPDLPEKNKNGFFVGPTIIKDVTPCNPLFTTEVFGPLVATIKIRGTWTTPLSSSVSPSSATARASSPRASSMPKSSAATPT
ncbi:MAG: aldehyde dehydrogenase family protein [Bilophila sp.]